MAKNRSRFVWLMMTAVILLQAHTIFADLLDMTDSDQLRLAEKYAGMLPDESDFIPIHISLLSGNEEALATQFQALDTAGVITKERSGLSVSSLFLNTFLSLDESEQTPESMKQLARAYGSKAFQYGMAIKNTASLTRLFRALQFGEQVHQDIEYRISRYIFNRVSLEFLNNRVLGRALAKSKPQITHMLASAYECNANAILYNAPWTLYPFSASPGNPYTDQFLSFMQQCKMSSKLQEQITKRAPLASELKNYANTRDLQLHREPLPEQFQSPSAGLYHIIAKARRLEGSLYLIAFRGKSKYQFATFGVYQGRLNFSHVVMDKTPAPTLTLSMPVEDVKEKVLVEGITALANGGPDNDSNFMDEVDSIWLIKAP